MIIKSTFEIMIMIRELFIAWANFHGFFHQGVKQETEFTLVKPILNF